MDHPVVSRCAALTAECVRKYLELDNSFASLESDNMRTSRDAVARSRQLIGDIKERDSN
jgi:hypothetical protein